MSQITHVVALVAVDVSSGRLPLRITIAAVTDLRERFVDVVIQGSVLPDVDLVTVGMRVGAGCVSCEQVRWLTANEALTPAPISVPPVIVIEAPDAFFRVITPSITFELIPSSEVHRLFVLSEQPPLEKMSMPTAERREAASV